VKTSATVLIADQGFDAAKKIAGRTRHLATHRRGITRTWADADYQNTAIEHAATRDIDLEVVHRTTSSRTVTVQPRRWVIERTLGRLMHRRRPARDDETHPYRSAAMIHLAMIDLMSRRLTGEATPNRRGT